MTKAFRSLTSDPRTLLWALLCGLLTMLLLGRAIFQSWPIFIDIGAKNDTLFIADFHETEHFDDMAFRWSAPLSELKIPHLSSGPTVLMLRMLTGYPEAVLPSQLTLFANEHTLGTFTLAQREAGLRRYRLLIPPDNRLEWMSTIRFENTTYSPPGDSRQLGVVLDWVRLEPGLPSAPFVSSIGLLSSFLFGMFFFLALGSLRIRSMFAGLAVMGLTLLLILALNQRPLEVLPFLRHLTAIPVIAYLAFRLIHFMLPIQQEQQSGQLIPHIAGRHLPALFAIVWWMLPIFQLVQVADGTIIGVGFETLVLGCIAAAILIVALVTGSIRSRGLKVSDRKAVIARYVLIALALGAAIHLAYSLSYAFTRSGKDFWILFKGTRDWVQGGSFYDLEAVMTNHVGAVFKVPPFYGMLFAPFVFQDGLQILFYHRLINVGLILATALVWLRMFRVRPLWWGLATIVILLNSRPLADTIAYGQIDLLLLFLLSTALWALTWEQGSRGTGEQGSRGAAEQGSSGTGERGNRGAGETGSISSSPLHPFTSPPHPLTPSPPHPAWADLLAGALIALGTLFKVYPVILLVFLVIKRRWWAVLGFGLGMLLYNGLSLAIVGWEMQRVYFFEVLPRIGGTTSWVENQTISGFLARLVDTPFEARLLENRSLSLLGILLSGLLSLGACVLSLRPAAPGSTRFGLQYSQFLLLMVLAVPAAWMHYETLLVLVFGVILLHLRERQLSLARASLLALSFALISYGNQWSFNGASITGLLTTIGVSYKFYGMLLLAGLMGMYLLEKDER